MVPRNIYECTTATTRTNITTTTKINNNIKDQQTRISGQVLLKKTKSSK